MAAPVAAAIGAVGNSGNIPVPSGVANGSKIVARTFVHWNGTAAHTTSEITPPTGFSVGGSRGQAAFGGFYWLDVWWWKDATGSDAGNYSFTVANSGVATGHALRVTGSTAVGVSPFVDTVRGAGSDASSSASIASFTPGGNDSLLLVGVLSGGTISSSGWTTVGTQALNADSDTVGVLSLTQATAAALNPTFTGSGGYIHVVVATLRGAAGAASATPDSASHAHAATSPTLTQHVAMTPAAATHAHSAGTPALTQHSATAPASSTLSHAATSPTLIQHAAVDPDDAAHGHAATSPSLVQHNALSPAAASHQHAATSPTLTVNTPGAVTPASATHAHTATSPALTQHHTIAPNAATNAHTATSPTLAARYAVTPADSAHAQTATSPTLSVLAGLAVSSSTLAHVATSPALVQHHVLAVGSAIHGHAATSPALVDGTLPTARILSAVIRAPSASGDVRAPTAHGTTRAPRARGSIH